MEFKRIGWTPRNTSQPGEYVVKAFTVPPGTWFIYLPVRVRWGYVGQQGPNAGISILWRDPIEPAPAAFSYSDHLDVEAGAPGDADAVYPLSCCIAVAQPTPLAALVRTTGVNVCTVVDGDGHRFGQPA